MIMGSTSGELQMQVWAVSGINMLLQNDGSGNGCGKIEMGLMIPVAKDASVCNSKCEILADLNFWLVPCRDKVVYWSLMFSTLHQWSMYIRRTCQGICTCFVHIPYDKLPLFVSSLSKEVYTNVVRPAIMYRAVT